MARRHWASASACARPRQLVLLMLMAAGTPGPVLDSRGDIVLSGLTLKQGAAVNASAPAPATTAAALPACSAALVYESSTHCCPGFGSQMNMLLLAYMVALATRRQFVWDAAHYSWGCPAGSGSALAGTGAEGAAPGGASGGSGRENCLFVPSACVRALPPRQAWGNCLVGAPSHACGTGRGKGHAASVGAFFGRRDGAIVLGSWEAGTLFNELIDYGQHYRREPACTAPLSRPRAQAVCDALLAGAGHGRTGSGEGRSPPAQLRAKAQWLTLFRLGARRVFEGLRPAVLRRVHDRLGSVAWRARGRAPPSDGYVAFHLRRGDKAGEAGYKPPSLAAYMRAAEASGKLGPQTQVFIATDDQTSVLAETKRFPGRHFVFMGHTPPSAGGSPAAELSGGHTEAAFNKQRSAARFSDHVDVLAELRLIARADLFVCCFASKLALLAEALRGEVGVVAPWGMTLAAWPRQAQYSDRAIDLDNRQQGSAASSASSSLWYPGGR